MESMFDHDCLSNPLIIDLHYMISVSSQEKNPESAFEEAKILGKTIQVLTDNPYIQIPDENNDFIEIPIKLTNLDLEQNINFCKAFGSTYRPAIFCVIGPISFDLLKY